MTTRVLVRAITLDIETLVQHGVLLPKRSRAITAMLSGYVGKLDVIFEQEFEYTEAAKEAVKE